VLLVEDESALADQLATALDASGYAVDRAEDGKRAEFLGATERYDAVLLDLGLPSMDGVTLLRRWRDNGITAPVLVLTARGTWHDKVLGIDSGADDYVSKPFQMEDVLDPRSARVTMRGAVIRLTTHEFRVLSYLMHHRGRVVSQGELVEHIYERDADRDSNTVEVFIARLRKKLGAEAIATVRGLGYRIGDA
jgi:two-component system OmpR family response regulator